MGQAWSEQKYDRKIKYLDYMENGERMQGVGFIKLELRDNLCNIRLQINGLYRRDRLMRSLLLLNGEEERELCKLQLADGGAQMSINGLDSRNLDGQGLRYEQMTGLRIPISEGKEIRCVWGGEVITSKEKTERAEEDEEKTLRPETIPPEEKNVHAEAVPPEEKDVHAEETLPEEMAVQAEEDPSAMPQPPTEESVMQDDKWEQLWAIYPHITPFHDGREYMSMGPADFVILPEQYYKLVNNSFLLHGYYNYDHLIMSRVEQRNGKKYYIGVPGNYYEREKKIAVMFGFENFECGAEPAEEGDFGYYMTPVEL